MSGCEGGVLATCSSRYSYVGNHPSVSAIETLSLRNEFQFKNAFTPRSDSSIFGRKKYYPVHVAARLGDCEVLRDLLLLGVDAQQKLGFEGM